MTKKYYLYCLCDPIEKIPRYIGISCDPDRRFKQHLRDKSITKKTKWIKSLSDNLYKPLLKIIKETDDVRKVIEWEIKAIDKYKDKFRLTNSTLGGEYKEEGTPINEYDLDGNFIDSYNSMTEYCELHDWNITFSTSISAVCLRKRNYCKNRIFRYVNDSVTKEDLDKLQKELHRRDPQHFIIVSLDGTLLGEFNSFQEAERRGFGRYSSISECLREVGGHSSVKGNLVCYDMKDYQNKLKRYRKSKAKGKEIYISKYDLDGNYIETFYNLQSAFDSIKNNSRNGIKQCLNGKQAQSGGFQWRYGDSKENIGKYIKSYNRGKKIDQFTLEKEFIKTWPSVRQASIDLKIDPVGIRKCAEGEYKQSGGFIWKYVENEAV